MSICSFSLKPFSSDKPEHFAISGFISREKGRLHMTITLNGPLELLRIPERSPHPKRKINLWKESCFELFFAEVNSEVYREVNLAPSGYWNVYRFSSYRQGMKQDEDVTSLECHIEQNQQKFTLEAALDLSPILHKNRPLRINISAVLFAKNNTLSFWALNHPGEKPDFHDPEGFILIC